jgi:hypothetical protein
MPGQSTLISHRHTTVLESVQARIQFVTANAYLIMSGIGAYPSLQRLEVDAVLGSSHEAKEDR